MAAIIQTAANRAQPPLCSRHPDARAQAADSLQSHAYGQPRQAPTGRQPVARPNARLCCCTHQSRDSVRMPAPRRTGPHATAPTRASKTAHPCCCRRRRCCAPTKLPLPARSHSTPASHGAARAPPPPARALKTHNPRNNNCATHTHQHCVVTINQLTTVNQLQHCCCVAQP